METTKFIVVAILGFTACHQSRTETYEKMCMNVSRCFRYANYGGCIAGAQSNDRGTKEELANAETAADATCDQLEILFKYQGIDTRWIK